jgi:hypothetical protein
VQVESWKGALAVFGLGIVAGIMLVFFNAYVTNPVEKKVGLAA